MGYISRKTDILFNGEFSSSFIDEKFLCDNCNGSKPAEPERKKIFNCQTCKNHENFRKNNEISETAGKNYFGQESPLSCYENENKIELEESPVVQCPCFESSFEVEEGVEFGSRRRERNLVGRFFFGIRRYLCS